MASITSAFTIEISSMTSKSSVRMIFRFSLLKSKRLLI